MVSLSSLMLFLNQKDPKNEGSIPAIDLEKSFASFQWDFFLQVLGTLKLGISLLWGRQLVRLCPFFKI